ncbi:MAG: hypothetical protein COV45_01535 [Deltaproteobacteria bacterium CG11_big_fil_rev_8_21_14_0_20_47_16]|nr:MAG: hypothetical protein COV45_01535 [Deltaproteobacteria bacterium CG11_big_fil_rev_8_21_14_0_20_47_16]
MPTVIYLNGRFVSEKDAKISVFDRSYLYGEGCFETLRSYDGHISFLKLHYYRLLENCSALGLDMPLDEYAFGRMLKQLINRNKTPNAYIRVTISAVGASTGMEMPKHMKMQVVAFCKAFEGKPQRWYTHGAKLVIAETVVADQPRLSNIKTTNYLTKMLARREANAAKAADALLTNDTGQILEGSASNLFVIKNGRLLTPPISDGILPGVTRSAVLGAADTLEIPWKETHFTVKTLKDADEIFITGSTSEVLPIAEISGICKKKAPGLVTKELMTAYSHLARG